MSLSEPTAPYPILTGGFSDFVPENRLYREQIGADVRPFDAAFANRPLGRLDIETKYHDTGGRTKPRLLDLFCGAGGASMGYYRAGFDVVGVDVNSQPHYPFEFHQGDALTWPLDGFDAIHASPPCQAFTQMSARWRGKGTKADEHLDLLTPMRARLSVVTKPWVIENVQGAVHHMSPTIALHGGMFGLGVHRPRLFESNVLVLAAKSPACVQPIGVYGTKPDGRTTYRYRNNGNMKGKSLIRAAKSIEEASEAMGIDWMDWPEIREAIPPVYTEFIGLAILSALTPRSEIGYQRG